MRQETLCQYNRPKEGGSRPCYLKSGTDTDDDTGIQGETARKAEAGMGWDSKKLVDDDSDADSMAPLEVQERPLVPVLCWALSAHTRVRRYYGQCYLTETRFY